MRLGVFKTSLRMAAFALALAAEAVAGPPQSADTNVVEQLGSADPTQVDAALAYVQRQPGAVSPFVFSLVSRVSEQRGDIREAVFWQLFGEYRINVDAVYAAEIEDLRATMMLGALASALRDRRSPAVISHLHTLPTEERVALLAEISGRDATARLYPLDWYAHDLMRIWTAAPATWPESSVAALSEIRGQLRESFERQFDWRPALAR